MNWHWYLRPCALVDHVADGIGEARAVDAVQDHLCHGKLTLHAFASRFEIERLGQAGPFIAALDGRLRIKPFAGIPDFRVFNINVSGKTVSE